MKKKKVTAVELMARLNADPEFTANRTREEESRQRRAAEWRRAEEPLVRALRAEGYDVASAWDLVNMSAPYPRALPILLDHLQQAYPVAVREGIARALAVRDAKFAWPVLVRLFREEQEERVKDGLAVALAAAADNDVMEDLIDLARDRRLGTSRVLLLRALERSRDPRASLALTDLADDPDLHKAVQSSFARRARRAKRANA
jgi:hypothetical protein